MTQLTYSYCHRGGDGPLLGATIPEHFAAIAARYADRDAVIALPQDRRLSYAELAAATDRLAAGLLGLGFKRGERIGIWATNNLEWLLLQMATARVGVVLVNINPAYRPRELAYALQRSEVQGLFCIPSFRSSDYVGMLLELMPALAQMDAADFQSEDFPHLRRVVVYDPAQPVTTGTFARHPGRILLLVYLVRPMHTCSRSWRAGATK